MAEAPATAAVAGDARLHSLDILRGLALLGMFVVHFHQKSTEPGGIDDVVRTLVWRLVESKSHGTFALLFGAGFAVMLGRAEQKGRPFAACYLRRLGVLALFGVAAHALFGFNVLVGYAVWGAALLIIHRWSTPALIVAAALCTVTPAISRAAHQQYLLAGGGPAAVDAAADAARAEAEAVNRAVDAAERRGSYRALVAARLAHMRWFHRQPFFVLPGATLTLFVVGLLLVRHGVFADPLAHGRLLAAMAGVGLASWIVSNWVVPGLALLVRDQWLTFTYVAAALVVLARWPAIAARLGGVASAGRMALTNYLLQIAGLDLLFSWYAVGVGEIRPLWGLVAALACFAAQVATSSLWLARFRVGPAEWLWRSVTYWRLEPLRRPVAASALHA